MKKRIMLVGRSVICVLLIGCTAFSVYSLRMSQTRGGYSDVCGRISPKAQKLILNEFGNCSTLEGLLQHLDDFAIQHFVYDNDKDYSMSLQTFDLDDFLFGKVRYQGLCFDFSCWVKDCVLVWADENNISIKAYVLDVKGRDYAHSYNVFFYKGRTYTLDVTLDHTRAKKGKQPEGPICWGDATIEQIAEHYGEKAVIWR